MVYLSSSVTAFLLHPLLSRRVQTEGGQTCWGTQVAVPEPESYRRAPYPPAATSLPAISLEMLIEDTNPQICNWFQARNIQVVDHDCAVFDPRTKKIYTIDMIVNRHGRVCVVLVFFTPNRIPKRSHAEILNYASEIHSVCAEIYAMSPTTLVLNAFFKPAIEGGGTGVAAISREFRPGQRQTVLTHEPRRRRRDNPPHEGPLVLYSSLPHPPPRSH